VLAVAVRDTPDLAKNDAEHVVPQEIPFGVLLTLPLPRPPFATVRVTVGRNLKTAPTVLTADMVTEHVPVPLHAPDQPAKVESDAGLATSFTTKPEVKLAEQVEPQLIPDCELDTVPEPVPLRVTVNV
jgi:hypothetical protein